MAHPNYIRPIGGLALDRYDAEKHFNGTGFRHNSNQIDINPSVIINGVSYITVDAALAAISSYITQDISGGQGFITVGDGYDTWHNANGTTNFDNTVPSLDTLLNPIFASIISHTALPPQYARIQRGGIVVIKAGTYIVVNTINVPPGIILMGEGYGTKIVNATSLNLSSNQPSPKGSPTPAPLFLVKTDPDRTSPPTHPGTNDDDASIDTPIFMFGRETVFANMSISDNFPEPPVLGDTNYQIPQNTLSSTPLIKQEAGSSLTLNNVKFYGRTSLVFTSSVVMLDTTITAVNGTILRVSDCFIDAFSVPIYWDALSTSQGVNNYLEVYNNKIRYYGLLNSNGSAVIDNSAIVAGYTNAMIEGNYFWGKNSTSQAGVFIHNHAPLILPSLQNRQKVICTGNFSAVSKTSSSLNTTYSTIVFDTFSPSVLNYYTSIVGNNLFQDQLGGLLVNAGNTPFTVPVSENKLVLICDTSSSALIINLPSAASTLPGTTITIKDGTGNAGTNTITINPSGSNTIEGLNVAKVIQANWGSVTLFLATSLSANAWVML